MVLASASTEMCAPLMACDGTRGATMLRLLWRRRSDAHRGHTVAVIVAQRDV